METKRKVLFGIAIVLFVASCGGVGERAASDEHKGPDPIVGVWSNAMLCHGGLWVGYTPAGRVVYMLDPGKAPGTLCSVEIINVIHQSSGDWSRDGSVYKVVQRRNGAVTRTAFYKMAGSQLTECAPDGTPASGGETWTLKLPEDAETRMLMDAFLQKR